MSVDSPPAIAGGTPVRTRPLAYGRHHIEESDIAAVVAALRSGALTGGAGIADFERALEERCRVKNAVLVANGSVALDAAVAALGIGRGDEVVTTPLTFVATANAVLRAGATPVFADVGADRCLDPASAAQAITARTKAVITVDYSGLPADVPALKAALPRPLPVVADSAHALGASLRGRPVGSLADVTTLSFHPVKHITTGEGGACLTDDDDLAARMRSVRNHGMTSTAEERSGSRWKYDVTMLGDNYRITTMQAALGISQLTRLEDTVAARSEIADRYDALLGEMPGVGLPPRMPDRRSSWHLYAIEIDEEAFGCPRDQVIDALRAEGIEATLHYPAVHLLSLYRSLGGIPGTAPRAERLCGRLVTLPLYPEMSISDQDDVVIALARIQKWAAAGALTR
jgi:perosamine synthetase